MHAIKQSDACLKAILAGDADTAARIVEQTHQENTSIIKYNDENSLSCVVTLALYSARNDYVFVREMPTGKGRADITLLPRLGKNLPAIVIELKKDEAPSVAITQIKARQYSSSLLAFSGEVILVGMSYSTNSGSIAYKRHNCIIEKISK